MSYEPQPENDSQPLYPPQRQGDYSGSSHTPLKPSPKGPNLLAIVVPIVVVLLIVAGVISTRPWDRGDPPPLSNTLKVEPKVGSLAPDFELKDVNTGQTVKLSSLRGRPVWVNFWATWCPPCREEMPDMEKIYGEYKGKNLAILGVDVQEDAGKVNQFTSSLELTYTFMLDSNSDTANRYEVTGMPSHFFVDKDGVIQAIHIGGFSSTTGSGKADPRDYLAKIVGP